MQFASKLLSGAFQSLISSFSVAYLAIFLPICVLIYTLLPQKYKKYLLLTASYVFFFLISGKLVVYLFLSTLSIHYFGIWLDRLQTLEKSQLAAAPLELKKQIKSHCKHQQIRVILLAVCLHIGVLALLKYSPFFLQNINTLLFLCKAPFSLQIPNFLQPIGISFFTLQAVSYLMDVYKKKIPADDNLLRLGLFLAFFPQIVEGPICRYEQTADKLWNAQQIRYSNLLLGAQRILFGLFKKLLVADRLNLFVKNVFDKGAENEGAVIAVAAIAYTIQLYMDFSGSMDAVLGSAQIFGIALPENFERPFFSKTIPEFWKRWHITLGTFFKDYIFFPLSMTRPMKKLTTTARKRLGNYYGPLIPGSIALFCVWFSNGLWHGAGWNYIFFGLYHFILILLGNLITPVVRQLQARLHVRAEALPYRIMQIFRTSVLVVIGELFFRASGLSIGLKMFWKIFTDFRFSVLVDGSLFSYGIDPLDFCVVGIALCVVFGISLLNEKGICVRFWLSKQSIPVRWGLLYLLILAIIVFGAYGIGYVPVDPMYANF